MSQLSPFPDSSSQDPLIKDETPGTTSTGQSTSPSTSEGHAKRPSMEGALPDLLFGAFLPCVPVALVSALLLTLIFYNEVKLDPGYKVLHAPTEEDVSDSSIFGQALQFKSTGGTPAYYARINPAVLATIVAWTSKIIPFITSSSMAVVAFFAGRRILDASRDKKTGHLPTPHQISILINLLSGAGFRPLYDTVMYRLQNHGSLVQPIPLAFGALSFVVVNTLLIGAADTWFAASTKPEMVELLTRIPTPEAKFGREFEPSLCNATDIWQTRQCPSNFQALCDYPCSITGWNASSEEREGVQNAEQAARALFSNSPADTILNISYHRDDNSYENQQYYFLGDVRPAQNIDFLTKTAAVSTQCQVITQDCQVDRSRDGFSCPGGYEVPSFLFAGGVGTDAAGLTGEETSGAVGIQFFKDSGLRNPIGATSTATELFSAQNPIHFLSWSRGFPPVDTNSPTFADMRDNGYLGVDSSGDNVFVLNCTSKIYTTTYAWVNGTILCDTAMNAFYPELAPPYYGAIFSAPFAINSALGHLSLQEAAALAAYRTTPEGLAGKFANEFSRSAVALTAGIMIPQTNKIEQLRNNTVLLTRVPKIPLYFLVSLKAIYALASLILAGLAVTFTGPSEAQEVKARLTVEGLAAGFFEPAAYQEKAVKKLEDLFGEHDKGTQKEPIKKVSIKQTDSGGWVWVATRVIQGLGIDGIVEAVVDNDANSGELGEVGRGYEALRGIT